MNAEVLKAEQAHAWELRKFWINRHQISIRFDDDYEIPRIRGTVEYVSTTGAFALICQHKDPDPTPWHITVARIAGIRRPHYSEPLDEEVIGGPSAPPDPLAGQMPLWED